MISAVDIFKEDGPLANNLPGYSVRNEQMEMVQAVEEAIEGRHNLLAEAGTGVGKSMAYLVPFIMWAIRQEKRVVISTYTKALQSQLFVKDLPFLCEALGEDVRYALCMGSDNYVCLKKAHSVNTSNLFDGKNTGEEVRKIAEWVGRTDSGLVTDMDFVPDRSVWDRFSRESDMCRGRKCAFFEDCFYMNARKAQSRAHILITNHSLLFTDMMSEAKLLPEFHALVLDEAHTLEDVATSHFGREFSRRKVDALFAGVKTALKGKYWPEGAKKTLADDVAHAKSNLKEASSASKEFFAKAKETFAGKERTVIIEEGMTFQYPLLDSLKELAASLHRLTIMLEEDESADEMASYFRRCTSHAEDLDFIFGRENQEYVYWTENRTRGKKTEHIFRAAPVDISDILRASLFDRISPVVLTSATLSSGKGGDFSYFKERLGLDDALEIGLDSPFDYRNNVLMYIPEERIDPAKDAARFRDHLFRNMINIYEIMGGRIFTLFTSYEMMNSLSSRIRKERTDIELHKQGELPRYVLLDVFKRSRRSILMGTTTFWQGVDVPGDALECVIITKLPFSVPNDPVISARIGAIRSRGGDPFHEYQIPRAVLMFKQGFGRLVRSHSDRGVVAVLDPRVRTRRYGSEFLDALPECGRTQDVGDVKKFFKG